MNPEVKTSFGTDDDQIKLRFRAKQLISPIGITDETFLKLSSKEYGVIRNGIIQQVNENEIDPNFLNAFSMFEEHPNPPKYPYLIELLGERHESENSK